MQSRAYPGFQQYRYTPHWFSGERMTAAFAAFNTIFFRGMFEADAVLMVESIYGEVVNFGLTWHLKKNRQRQRPAGKKLLNGALILPQQCGSMYHFL